MSSDINDLEKRIHRTWVHFLLDRGYKDLAAIAIESELHISYDSYGNAEGMLVDIPASFHQMVTTEGQVMKTMQESLDTVCHGHITDRDGQWVVPLGMSFRVKLLGVEEGWQNITRSLIASSKQSNQAVVTEKIFLKNGKEPYLYNEMKFGSQAEIRIAQEFESRRVLFFPLPLAVRAETGKFYEDHREADFLVCDEGTWGILEVSYHPDRYEKDAEKDTWFKKSGILCVQPYTAERCYKNSAEVVSEFLSILAKHKR